MRKIFACLVLAAGLTIPSHPATALPDIEPVSGNAATGFVPSSITKEPAAPKPLAQKKKKRRPAKPTLLAKIDLTRQRMTIVSNGKKIYRWRISSGRAGYETPPGKFKPGWMARQWYSRKYDMAPMPYSVFFNQGIATHGTTAVSRLGRPASHGCIRLKTSNARRFYNLVRKHGMARTQIIVKGRAKQTRTRTAKRPRRYRPRSVASYQRTPSYRPARRIRRSRPERFVRVRTRY